jgi:hypothetical protein
MWLPITASPLLDILIPLSLFVGGIPGATPGADMGYPVFARPPQSDVYNLSIKYATGQHLRDGFGKIKQIVRRKFKTTQNGLK